MQINYILPLFLLLLDIVMAGKIVSTYDKSKLTCKDKGQFCISMSGTQALSFDNGDNNAVRYCLYDFETGEQGKYYDNS
jgi:hypothetical protein